MVRWLVSIPLMVVGLGCDSSATAGSFDYNLTKSGAFAIRAHDAAGPVAGVLVSIRAASPSPGLAGELLWMGATDAQGDARAILRMDRAGDALDVTLHRPGWRGPWTDEAERAAEGVTAPSARLVLSVQHATGVDVTLVRSL